MGRQNETVNVTTFTLPKAMNEQTFTLNVLNDKSYQLVSDGGFSVRGQVGKVLEHDGVTMLVEAIHASPESQFTVRKFSTLGMINTLQNNLMVAETGKDTGVLSLTLPVKTASKSARSSTVLPVTICNKTWNVNPKRPPKVWRFWPSSCPKCVTTWMLLKTS